MLYKDDLEIKSNYFGYQRRVPDIHFLGHYEGKWILTYSLTDRDWGPRRDVFYDIETGEETIIAETKSNAEGFFGGGYGEVKNVVLKGNEMLRVTPVSDKEKEVSIYHADTGETEALFTLNLETDEWLDFRGETGDYLVTTKRGMGNTLNYYIVEKEDFKEHNLDHAKRIPISL